MTRDQEIDDVCMAVASLWKRWHSWMNFGQIAHLVTVSMEWNGEDRKSLASIAQAVRRMEANTEPVGVQRVEPVP